MLPTISTRAYIQFPPSTPVEPTSTLVLTSRQNRFVDTRILLSALSLADECNKIDPAQIDWAFAGHSTSTTTDDSPPKVLTQWHHWVDSKTTAPEEVVDRGEMGPEDAEGLALERGEMVNPGTGRVEGYVEGWRDVRPLFVPQAGEDVVEVFRRQLEDRRVAFVPGSVLGDGGFDLSGFGGGKVGLSLVLRCENLERQARGVVVRVGQFRQGVLRVGEEFGLERWEWERESGWQKTCAVGNLDVPCDVLAYLGETVFEGSTVRYGDGDDEMWECVEAERFSI